MVVSVWWIRIVVLTGALLGLVAWCGDAFAVGDYGPETCQEGFVWREACGPNDHVCVTPQSRAQAAQDDALAASRREPNGGPYGPDTCRQGFVWREACGPQDHVCVPAATRTQAARDNAMAASRFKQTPILWDVLTQHNDAARTGLQPHETVLTPANVAPATFGRLYERHVEGQVIAQPLYVSNQWLPGRGLKNVVYVATRKNWIYAFDADDLDPDPGHGLLWRHAVQVEADAPVPNMCGETRGSVGINSTPVIDRATDTLYVVARKADGSVWLHALDISTGQPHPGKPAAVRIGASLSSNGQTVNFDQGLELSRAALLLQNGAIFIAFSALNCDNANWHGWVLAYRAPDLQQVGAFITSPTNPSPGAGIWQSGNGLVGDGTNVYFETGNRQYGTPPDSVLDEAFVKLRVGPAPFYGLSLAGHYTVANREALNGGDTDLGSGGPVLLPGGRLVGGGKQGKLYVLDTGSMAPTQNPPGAAVPGGSDGFQAFVNSWHSDPSQVVCDDEGLVQRNCFLARHFYENGEMFGPNIHTGPVFWAAAGPGYGLLYGMPEKDYLRAFRYDAATRRLATAPAAVSATRSPDGMPGTFLSISANGSRDGLIWALTPEWDSQWQNGPGHMIAFDARTLRALWRDDDDIGFAKFNPPTVAGGKVFRPTFADKLVVYGLKPGPTAAPCYGVAQKYQNFTGPEGSLGGATGAETVAADGVGHVQTFAGGWIDWTPATCAWAVQGAILGVWAGSGAEHGVLGYPLTDETITPDGIGRYNHFQGGSIYWTPLTGAHEIQGLIRDRWASLGWERSAFGYPVTDETDEVDGSGRFNVFEHGTIHWNRATNAITATATPALLNGPGQGGTDRPGLDIQSFALPAANAALCQQRCADAAACQAWTYVNPGVQGAQAMCWLKGGTPLPQANACCISGLKVGVQPPSMSAMDGALDRAGADFTSFDLPGADPHLCQGECANNPTCRAWAFVRPDLAPGSPPRCWLKTTSVIAAVGNGCCVSGTKH